jgi:hypothetical protein
MESRGHLLTSKNRGKFRRFDDKNVICVTRIENPVVTIAPVRSCVRYE